MIITDASFPTAPFSSADLSAVTFGGGLELAQRLAVIGAITKTFTWPKGSHFTVYGQMKVIWKAEHICQVKPRVTQTTFQSAYKEDVTNRRQVYLTLLCVLFRPAQSFIRVLVVATA